MNRRYTQYYAGNNTTLLEKLKTTDKDTKLIKQKFSIWLSHQSYTTWSHNHKRFLRETDQKAKDRRVKTYFEKKEWEHSHTWF